MTLPVQNPVTVAQGDGVNVTWNYNFEVPYQANGITPAVEVLVQIGVADPVVVNPSLYTITGVGVETGGVVTYPLVGAPLTGSDFIIIRRALAYSQESAFPNTFFLPSDIEVGLDRLAMMIQQIAALAVTDVTPVIAGVATFNGRQGAVTLTSGDVTGALGYTPVSKTVPVLTGKLVTRASVAGSAAIKITGGVSPTAPGDGDLWHSPGDGGLYFRLLGVTYNLIGGNFDENTQFTLGGNATGNLSLKDRLKGARTLFDYGMVGDGVTDNTAAWNRMVADVNAQAIKSVFIPAGKFLLPGDLNPMNHGIDLYGTGANSILATTNGTGTSIIIDFENIPFTEFVTLRDFKMTASVAPKVRQAIQISWATEPLVCQITNVTMDGAFAKGIGLHNCVSGRFANVQINQYNWTTNQWAWNLTSDVGRYSVDNQWTNCQVSGAQYAWKGSGHMQGFVWLQCEAGFSGYGVYLDNIPIAGVNNGPEMMWIGGSMECIHRNFYLNNWSYITIADSWLLYDGSGSPGDISIELQDCFCGTIHGNLIGGPAGSTWAGVLINGNYDWYGHPLDGLPTSSSIKVHDNEFRILTGIGVAVSGSTRFCEARNNYFQAPQAAAMPFNDTTGTGANYHSGSRSDNGAFGVNNYFDTFGGATVAGPVVVDANVNWTRICAAPALPVSTGERFRIQWKVTFDNPSQVASTVSFRIREYNHRPSAPSPFQIISFANGTQTIDGNQFLPQFASPAVNGRPEGSAASFVGEVTVKIVGEAADALIVMEGKTDFGTAEAVNVSFFVERV
jgi:hypothetical protein